MSKDIHPVNIVGPVINGKSDPSIEKVRKVLGTIGVSEGKDNKLIFGVSDYVKVDADLVKFNFKSKNYLLRFYSQEGGLQGLEIVKGGSVSSRRELRDKLRSVLHMRRRKD